MSMLIEEKDVTPVNLAVELERAVIGHVLDDDSSIYVKDDTLCLDYALMYWDGLLRETFVRGCRQFARSVEKSIAQADPPGGFILPPGETEANDAQGEDGNEGEEGGA